MFQQFLFGIKVLHPACYDHFPDLISCQPYLSRPFPWIEVFCKLLADGTATAGGGVLHKHGFYRHPEEALVVHPGMFIKTLILYGNQGI